MNQKKKKKRKERNRVFNIQCCYGNETKVKVAIISIEAAQRAFTKIRQSRPLMEGEENLFIFHFGTK